MVYERAHWSYKFVLEERAKLARDKAFARSQVAYAIKKGRLKKQPCHCGEKNVQAHHEDYSEPLKVTWVCRKHHSELDKKRRLKDAMGV